jgi:hypothetical protein
MSSLVALSLAPSHLACCRLAGGFLIFEFVVVLEEEEGRSQPVVFDPHPLVPNPNLADRVVWVGVVGSKPFRLAFLLPQAVSLETSNH